MVLGSKVELAKRCADAGSGGIGRALEIPDGDAGSPRGVEKGTVVDGEEDVAAVAGGGDTAERAGGEENVAAVTGGGAAT
uniref:DUF834 domain-containing protein n=1 Tax=Oryza rufipogon TaxID=4529 RepID=A0A0E0PV85_ORYRU